jgi:hypothetical protein
MVGDQRDSLLHDLYRRNYKGKAKLMVLPNGAQNERCLNAPADRARKKRSNLYISKAIFDHLVKIRLI